MSCNHQTTRERWVEEEDWYHGGSTGHWEYETQYTTVDHSSADDVLCALLSALGYDDVVTEYHKVNKWYA